MTQRCGGLLALRRVFARAKPSPAHRALARLERGGRLDGVVTQNVDGLHREAGSSRVVEIHGSFLRRVCLGCERRADVSREEFLDGLDRAIRGLAAS